MSKELDLPCEGCDGCGKVADTPDREPWTRWTALPLQSAAAVVLGVVKPIPCPYCNGTGRISIQKDGEQEPLGGGSSCLDIERVRRFVVQKLLPVAPEATSLQVVFRNKVEEEWREVKGACGFEHQIEEVVDTVISLLAFAMSTVPASAGPASEIIEKVFKDKMQVLEGHDWYYNARLGVFKRVK